MFPDPMKLKQSQLPAYRAEQLAKQQGLDPITGLKIVNPCLDHDHVTGKCRMVLEREVNAFEGKVFNAWRRYLRHLGVPIETALSGIIRYYASDFSCNPTHSTHKDAEEKRELRNKRARRKRKQKAKQ